MLRSWATILFLFLSAAVFGQSQATKYIEAYKEAAVRIMKENGIPASIVLGIAIHESGSGTSTIARVLNNHFGFKGPNNNKTINSAYKGYESVEASYADFVSVLKRRPKFSPLFENYSSFDYYGWVRGIQRGGYASSSAWGSKVLAIIKRYELYQFDNAPTSYTDSIKNSVNVALKNAAEPAATDFIYKVKSGDTLSEIALKHHTTVKTIQTDNGLKTTHLSIGQKLKIRTRK